MEAFIFFGGIAFVAGIIARSLFAPQRQPQIIYVQAESSERGGEGGCLPLILVGAVLLLVLAAAGA